MATKLVHIINKNTMVYLISSIIAFFTMITKTSGVLLDKTGPFIITQSSDNIGAVPMRNCMNYKFDLMINNWCIDDWCSIIHIGNDRLQRMPGIFMSSTIVDKFYIAATTTTNNSPNVNVGPTAGLSLNTIYSFDITYDQPSFTTIVNDEVIYENPTWGNHCISGETCHSLLVTDLVPIYIGDNWYQALDGSISNLLITNCGPEINPPSMEPSLNPSSNPTSKPTKSTNNPTSKPTPLPTNNPTSKPTPLPTRYPTSKPTPLPTNNPTSKPTPLPTNNPTFKPSPLPTNSPTLYPSQPTANPTLYPSEATADPTLYPSEATSNPTLNPSEPTADPTLNPTKATTKVPTLAPTIRTKEPSQSLKEGKISDETTTASEIVTESKEDKNTYDGDETSRDETTILLTCIIVLLLCIVIILIKRERKKENDEDVACDIQTGEGNESHETGAEGHHATNTTTFNNMGFNPVIMQMVQQESQRQLQFMQQQNQQSQKLFYPNMDYNNTNNNNVRGYDIQQQQPETPSDLGALPQTMDGIQALPLSESKVMIAGVVPEISGSDTDSSSDSDDVENRERINSEDLYTVNNEEKMDTTTVTLGANDNDVNTSKQSDDNKIVNDSKNVSHDIWNAYIKQFGSAPSNVSQLQNFSKINPEFDVLNFKQAREVFNTNTV